MENRGVGYKTDMERGRKKEERKNTPSSPAHTFTVFTHSLLTLWPHACLCTHTFTVTQDAYLLHAHILLVFRFLSPSQSVFPFFFRQTYTYTHTPLWGDWCCKLAWVCRWSGCDYCLALRQLWWWHSVLWAPLAWARSKHNQAVHSLYLATMHTCGLDTTATHTQRTVPNVRLHTQVVRQQKKRVSCLLCAPWGQTMCMSLRSKVTHDLQGDTTFSVLHTLYTMLITVMLFTRRRATCSWVFCCSSNLFYLSVLSPPLSVFHLLRVSVCLI